MTATVLLHLALFLPLFSLDGFPAASDSWAKKPYTEWTEDEAVRILADSPWSKTWYARATVRARPREAVVPSSQDQPTGEHSSCCRTFGSGVSPAASDPRNTPAAPGQEVPPGISPPRDFYRVIWFSSMHVRQALYRLRLLQGEPRDPVAETLLVQPFDRIVIALSGPSMARFQGASLSNLKGSTHLRSRKGKKEAELVAFVSPETRPDRLALFVFARPIDGRTIFAERDSEIEFKTGEGRDAIGVSFRLRQMLTNGTPDL